MKFIILHAISRPWQCPVKCLNKICFFCQKKIPEMYLEAIETLRTDGVHLLCWRLLLSYLNGHLWLFALKLWEVAGTYEWYFYECRLSGGDTQNLPTVIIFFKNFAFTGSGDAKTSVSLPLTPMHPLGPKSHLVKLSERFI